MSEPVLTVSTLSAGYGATTVVRSLDLSVALGETAVVIGPNGHGKTTLLRTISGLLKPSGGHVTFDGQDITGRPAERISTLGLVHVPQGDGLFAEMTVEDNLLMGAFGSAAWKDRKQRLNRVYDKFPGVKARSDQQARTLSGGERRLTALGRALMRDATLLIIDEPSLGLSPVAVDAVYEAIADMKAANTTVLLVEENFTHIGAVADTVHVLEMGSIVTSGTYQEISQDATVAAAYLGSLEGPA